MTSIPFLDLSGLHDVMRAELDEAWHLVADTNAFVGGAGVAQFEAEWAEYCGGAHAIGVANGTDALEAILAGLGIGPGDEVIVPANTFIASAEAVVNVGASPVFVDVDPCTLLITPEAIEGAYGPRSAAVIVVHLYGQMADMESVVPACRRLGLALVEDAAQAHGATWRGRRAGSFGRAAAFSFYPGKNLGAFGDGGAVVTDDADLAEHIRSLTAHGRSPHSRYEHVVRGRNSRLDNLQAAVLSIKLSHLDGWNDGRRRVHDAYRRHLDPAAGQVGVRPEAGAVHHLEVLRVPERDRLGDRLDAAGIGWGIHYPIPCHRQPAFAESPGRAPVAEAVAPRLLSLPMYPHLTEADVESVAAVVNDHVAGT